MLWLGAYVIGVEINVSFVIVGDMMAAVRGNWDGVEGVFTVMVQKDVKVGVDVILWEGETIQ